MLRICGLLFLCFALSCTRNPFAGKDRGGKRTGGKREVSSRFVLPPVRSGFLAVPKMVIFRKANINRRIDFVCKNIKTCFRVCQHLNHGGCEDVSTSEVLRFWLNRINSYKDPEAAHEDLKWIAEDTEAANFLEASDTHHYVLAALVSHAGSLQECPSFVRQRVLADIEPYPVLRLGPPRDLASALVEEEGELETESQAEEAQSQAQAEEADDTKELISLREGKKGYIQGVDQIQWSAFKPGPEMWKTGFVQQTETEEGTASSEENSSPQEEDHGLQDVLVTEGEYDEAAPGAFVAGEGSHHPQRSAAAQEDLAEEIALSGTTPPSSLVEEGGESSSLAVSNGGEDSEVVAQTTTAAAVAEEETVAEETEDQPAAASDGSPSLEYKTVAAGDQNGYLHLPLFMGFMKKCFAKSSKTFSQVAAEAKNISAVMAAHDLLQDACGGNADCVRLAYCEMDLSDPLWNFVSEDIKSRGCEYESFFSLPPSSPLVSAELDE